MVPLLVEGPSRGFTRTQATTLLSLGTLGQSHKGPVFLTVSGVQSQSSVTEVTLGMVISGAS